MYLQLVHVGKAAKKENKGREEETVISFVFFFLIYSGTKLIARSNGKI
jgi:hypothetical protein